MKPTVSVGVPVFNGEKSILRCLAGLQSQTCQSFEVIILDNCSTDGTEEICLNFVKSHPNFTYIRNHRNFGGAANLNRALGAAKGEYFMWAAHDDFHNPGFIKSCLKLMLTNPTAVLCNTGMNVCIDSVHDLTFRITMKTFKNIENRVKRFKEAYLRFPSPGFYGLYRTNIIRQIREIQPIVGAEYPWALELSLLGEFVSCDSFDFYYINSLTQINSYETRVTDEHTLLLKIQNYISRQLSYLAIVSRSELSIIEKIQLFLFIIGRFFLESTLKVFLTAMLRLTGSSSKIANFVVKRFLINPNYLVDDYELFKIREFPRILKQWTF